MIFLSSLFISLYAQAIHSNYNVILTQGETYSLYMKELFKNQIQNFSIKDCPNNVYLINGVNKLSEQNNNQTFISISSTSSLFLLITQANTLNIYKWNYTYMNSTYVNLINQVELPQQICLNSILLQENSIIIDCYNLTNLNIYIYRDNVWTIVYSNLVEQIPQKTDLKSFNSNSINSILYAQYYDDYQILTQFQFSQNLLQNISTWIKPFINFIVSDKLQSQNTIYLWNNNYIYLLNLTQQGLNLTYNYSSFSQNIIAVQIFNPQRIFYECDILLIITKETTYKYIFCNQTLPYSYRYFSWYKQSYLNTYINQVFLSNQFLILQLFDLIEIYEIIDLDFNLIGGFKINSSSTQISFDYNSNVLFIFSDTQILTYLVDYPQIKFIAEQNQSNYQFTIIGIPYQINQTDDYQCQNCTVELNVSVLPINDNQTYLIYNETSKQSQIIFKSQNLNYYFTEFSGSLLTANFSVENSTLGNFNDITFQNVNVSFINQQSFQNFQILNMYKAIGITNQTIYLCQKFDDYDLQYECYEINKTQSQINIKNNQIQAYSYSFGVQINKQQLYLCINCQSYSNSPYILNFEAFQQFYLLFQQIVLLLESKVIQICSFSGNCSNLIINNYSFIPVGIVLNQQQFSSTLFINNNQRSIIIGQITQSNNYIINSIINVTIQVQDIKIVNNRLILSYNCQKIKFICFQVWNVQNLNFPFLEKNLKSIQNTNNIQFFADNLLYYVQTNNQIYVYNPIMLEHSSLFYTFNYTGSYFTTYSQDVAFISFNSQIYQLSPLLIYSYQSTQNNTILNEISSWSNIYNSSVQSQIGTQNVFNNPVNQTIIILNDFLNISQNNNNNTPYHVSESPVILTKNNITSSGQIGWFDINCTNSKSQVINILNQTNFTSINCQIITVFNQQILCTNSSNNDRTSSYQNYSLQLFNMTSEGKFIQASNKEYKELQQCIKINAQMNASYIFINCYQQNLLGYQENDLFRINITNQSLGNITYLTRLNQLNVRNFILQDDILYISGYYHITIYDTSLNISQSILKKCQMPNFQPFVFYQSNQSFYAIIYICQNDPKLYYQLGRRYQQENITFISPKHLQIQDYFQFDSYLVGIQIVKQQINQFAIMCFIKQFNIIIKLEYVIDQMDFSQSCLKFKRLLQYSPPIMANNSYRFVDAVISNDLVFVNYQNKINIYYYHSLSILYNVSDFNIRNYDSQYLLTGAINQQQIQQMIQLPLILTFNSSYGFLLNSNYYQTQYKISSLKIEIYLQSLTDTCNLTAYNFVNQMIANYTFHYKSQTDLGFEYALIALLIIVFIAATILIWYRTKDQKEQFGLEEFEELEIETFQ
ncbi:unnamed protein product [Paramecium primaurelia]|uniref:Transmembrane protein n=1 Tax=Paramecium primaurelia TaxID=5886 RepID=A0A8S1LCX3_PARPR|nr:unnamed protein product [Paramecium primaurelia]